jgi:hypothetical protein
MSETNFFSKQVDSKGSESQSPNPNGRRGFLLAAAGAGLALGGLRSASANADKKGGACKGPLAKPSEFAALGYVEDAKKTDKKKFPRYEAHMNCHNCILYQFRQAGATDPCKADVAPCPALQNKCVKGAGWCNSWAPNPAAKCK